MEVIGWTSFDSECQGICVEEKGLLLDALNATIRAIRENEYIFSGETHQNGFRTVPVFDNGKCLRSSMRAWGMLMSFAYTGEDKSYMDFYMDQAIDEEKLPEEEVFEDCFDLECEVNGFPYYYSNQDLQLVAESISADMQLMTFDKVVLILYDELKKRMQGK